MDNFRIALAQLEPRLFDKAFNIAKAEEYIKLAAEGNAAAIIFPELYLTGYSLVDRTVELAERLDGRSILHVAELARVNKITVIMGFPELSEDGNHAFDSMFIINSTGKILDSYQKIHLYSVEKSWFLAGDKFSVVDFGLGPVGLLICYDLEFPEASRTLALNGAKWIATCTGNMEPNQHLQEINIQTRAAENRLWVAVANRVGCEDHLKFFGGSAVANPHGTITAQAGNNESLIFADIDLTTTDQARLNADYLADRRPDLYNITLKK